MTKRLDGPLLDLGFPGREFFTGFPIGRDPGYVHFYDDFTYVALDATNLWTVVKDSSASVAIEADTLNGRLKLTSQATTDDDGASIQGNEIWQPRVNKEIWVEAKLQVSDADDMDMFFGLTENFAASPEAALTASNRIGFQIDDGDATILCKTEASDEEDSVSSGVDAADATDVTLGIHVVGTSRVDFYVDRSRVTRVTTNIPTALMALAAMEISGSATGTKSMSIDYIIAAMTR